MHTTVTQRDPRMIDWAAVAAKARADLGDERVARFSERLRTTMMVVARSGTVLVGTNANWSARISSPVVGDGREAGSNSTTVRLRVTDADGSRKR